MHPVQLLRPYFYRFAGDLDTGDRPPGISFDHFRVRNAVDYPRLLFLGSNHQPLQPKGSHIVGGEVFCMNDAPQVDILVPFPGTW
jgi:hypothetical protein